MDLRRAALLLLLAGACAPASEEPAQSGSSTAPLPPTKRAHTTIASLLQAVDLEEAVHPDGIPPRVDLAGPGLSLIHI